MSNNILITSTVAYFKKTMILLAFEFYEVKVDEADS